MKRLYHGIEVESSLPLDSIIFRSDEPTPDQEETKEKPKRKRTTTRKE